VLWFLGTISFMAMTSQSGSAPPAKDRRVPRCSHTL
jgi:hypothetical protein